MSGKNGARKRVSAAAFVEAWRAGDSLAAVARDLGMAEDTCSVRASRYRRIGIDLKRFSLNAPISDADVRALNNKKPK